MHWYGQRQTAGVDPYSLRVRHGIGIVGAEIQGVEYQLQRAAACTDDQRGSYGAPCQLLGALIDQHSEPHRHEQNDGDGYQQHGGLEPVVHQVAPCEVEAAVHAVTSAVL